MRKSLVPYIPPAKRGQNSGIHNGEKPAERSYSQILQPTSNEAPAIVGHDHQWPRPGQSTVKPLGTQQATKNAAHTSVVSASWSSPATPSTAASSLAASSSALNGNGNANHDSGTTLQGQMSVASTTATASPGSSYVSVMNSLPRNKSLSESELSDFSLPDTFQSRGSKPNPASHRTQSAKRHNDDAWDNPALQEYNTVPSIEKSGSSSQIRGSHPVSGGNVSSPSGTETVITVGNANGKLSNTGSGGKGGNSVHRAKFLYRQNITEEFPFVARVISAQHFRESVTRGLAIVPTREEYMAIWDGIELQIRRHDEHVYRPILLLDETRAYPSSELRLHLVGRVGPASLDDERGASHQPDAFAEGATPPRTQEASSERPISQDDDEPELHDAVQPYMNRLNRDGVGDQAAIPETSYANGRAVEAPAEKGDSQPDSAWKGKSKETIDAHHSDLASSSSRPIIDEGDPSKSTDKEHRRYVVGPEDTARSSSNGWSSRNEAGNHTEEIGMKSSDHSFAIEAQDLFDHRKFICDYDLCKEDCKDLPTLFLHMIHEKHWRAQTCQKRKSNHANSQLAASWIIRRGEFYGFKPRSEHRPIYDALSLDFPEKDKTRTLRKDAWRAEKSWKYSCNVDDCGQRFPTYSAYAAHRLLTGHNWDCKCDFKDYISLGKFYKCPEKFDTRIQLFKHRDECGHWQSEKGRLQPRDEILRGEVYGFFPRPEDGTVYEYLELDFPNVM